MRMFTVEVWCPKTQSWEKTIQDGMNPFGQKRYLCQCGILRALVLEVNE